MSYEYRSGRLPFFCHITVGFLLGCLLAIPTVVAGAETEPTAPPGALWLALEQGTERVDTLDGVIASPRVSLPAARAVAADPVSGEVWQLTNEGIEAFGYDGILSQEIEVTLPQGETARLLVAPDEGGLWAAIDDRLVQISLSGQVLHELEQEGTILDLRLHPDGTRLWFATDESLHEVDPLSGLVVRTLELERGNQIRGFDLDAQAGRLWVTLASGIQAFNLEGSRIFEIDLEGASDSTSDGAGGAWVAVGPELSKITSAGEVELTTMPFGPETPIRKLLYDAGNLSCWAVNDLALAKVSAGGEVLAKLSLDPENAVVDLAMYAGALEAAAPQVSFENPVAGSEVPAGEVIVELALSDSGSGVDRESVEIAAYGFSLDLGCTPTASGLECNAAGLLDPGEVTLSATVADYAGNLSLPAEVVFTVLDDGSGGSGGRPPDATTPLGDAGETPVRSLRGHRINEPFMSVNEIESINLANGNVLLRVPLGQVYSVGPVLAYQLLATHNSDVWEHHKLVCPPGVSSCGSLPNKPMAFAVPNPSSNAGLGWEVHFGKLYAPCPPSGADPWLKNTWPNRDVDDLDANNRWLYVAPDGSAHSLHQLSGRPWHTSKDGSYLRMKEVSSTVRLIQHPNGLTTVFRKTGELAGTDVCGGAATGCWRFHKLRDQNGNFVRVTYSISGQTEIWTITDSLGRVHKIFFSLANSPRAGGDGGSLKLSNSDEIGDLRRVVTRVEVASFNGGIAPYTFHYTNRTMSRGCDTDPTMALAVQSRQITVPVLDRINIPDSQDFEFETHALASGFCNDANGLITEVTSPSQGKTSYQYGNWYFPTQCVYTNDPDPEPELEYRRLGIGTKTIRREDGSVGGEWNYQTGLYPLSGLVHSGMKCSRANYRETIVSGPPVDGRFTRQKLYNAVTVGPRSPSSSASINSWQVTDNSLPLSKENQKPEDNHPHRVGSGASARFLSQVTEECTSDTACTKLRSRYVRYEQEFRPCHKNLGDSPGCFSVNPVLVAERTVFHDDGGKYVEARRSQHDGAGHLRTTTTEDNFTGTTLVQESTDYTDTGGTTLTVSAGTGYFAVGTPSTYLPSLAAPWILHRFDKLSRTDSGILHVSEFEFDNKGLLICTRKRKSGAARSGQDIVTQLSLNSSGLPASTTVAGGDTANLSTSALCSTTGLAGNGSKFTFNHTYQHGILASSRIATFPYSYRATVDQNTALEKVVFNPSDQKTAFTYDRLGRMLTATPEASLQLVRTIVTYINPPGSKAQVTTQIKFGTTELAFEKRYFDHLGRVVRHLIRRPSGLTTWADSEMQTVYDLAGRVKKKTTMQVAGAVSPAKATEFTKYDPFGRPRRIKKPDGQVEQRTYQGVRRSTSTVQLATAGSGALVPRTTVTLFDSQGRTSLLSNPLYTTRMVYDPAGQVRQFIRSGGGKTQSRFYIRDGRGFLTRETLPEIGVSVANGNVDYTRDALGNPRTSFDGLHSLIHLYDSAGRPTAVKQGSQLWQEWVYSSGNVGTNYSKGKVIEATRHNYPLSPSDDWAFHESYEYRGAGGQLSRKTLQQRFPLEPIVANRYAQTFEQTWTYDNLGNVKTSGYPACVTTPQNSRQFCNDAFDFPAPAHTATTTYNYGLPVKVQGSIGAMWAEYDYYPNLQIAQIAAANGTVSSFDQGVNGMPRPRRIQHRLGGVTHFDSGLYSYDGGGNIRAIGADGYVYDQAGRLLSGTVKSAGTNRREDYTYDSLGNILTLRRDSGPVTAYNIEWQKNRMRGSAGTTDIFYDGAGNMTDIGFLPGASQPIYEMTYDALNMQSAFWDNGTSGSPQVYRYLYGPGNYRIIVYDSATGTRHWKLRDQEGSILREHSVTGWGWYQSSGSPGEQWVFEKDFLNGPNGLVASRNSGGGRNFFFRDHLGSTRLILGGNGSLKTKRAFYPYGIEVNILGFQDEPTSKFTGHERDMHDLTDYMMGRTCAYPFMRFMSVDPVRDTWNLYSYVNNSPINFTDPTGYLLKVLDEAALELIRQSVPEEVREFVALDENGLLDAELLESSGSSDANVRELLEVARSPNLVEASTAESHTDAAGTEITFFYTSVDDAVAELAPALGLEEAQRLITMPAHHLGIFYPKEESRSGRTQVIVSAGKGAASSAPAEELTVTMAHELLGHALLYLKGDEFEHDNGGEVDKHIEEVEKRTFNLNN